MAKKLARRSTKRRAVKAVKRRMGKRGRTTRASSKPKRTARRTRTNTTIAKRILRTPRVRKQPYRYEHDEAFFPVDEEDRQKYNKLNQMNYCPSY
eukprot:TRINITY_DN714_c0_g1_i3.p1 TRINITY_DN714_c0_g1~~TRINITY_DN714_c0_g1_i3.p1  ORF type:complete len:95 (+),score=2.91 TRINITY_DN714_c0_g1_i3:116-400(+)